MKNLFTISALIIAIIIGGTITGSAQNDNCTQCQGGSATGTNASVVGKNNTASGNNAFAGGYNTTASGSNSFAFGYNSKASQSTNVAIGNTAQATGIGTIAIGNYVKSNAQNSIVIGAGTTNSYPLTNTTPNSIALGMNSTKPTLLITKALNNSFTGKVAIGNITLPLAKLHIKSDLEEDADIFIEPSNKRDRKASLYLFDNAHKLSVNPSGSLEMNSGTGSINLTGDFYCFGGSTDAKTRIYTQNVTGIYINARRSKNTEIRDVDAPSYAIDFLQEGVRFRTAKTQVPRGTDITNWQDALYLCTDGKIGLGSIATYIENTEDQVLKLQSPGTMNLNSQQIELNANKAHLNATNIRLNGQVGINTDSEVEDYALAVNGGIISTKVFVKEVAHWPDHVFSDLYPLMHLNELKRYIDEHHHLPGVPSEKEITANGYDLHEMQYIMMEKIEETTRYLLALQEEIDSLKAISSPAGQVCFTYDESGNRISRHLTFKKIENQEPSLDNEQTFDCDLFPNPTAGQFTVVIKDAGEHPSLHATLLNASGTIIEERVIHGNQSVFDLSAFANGVFILHLETPEGAQHWQVIKQ